MGPTEPNYVDIALDRGANAHRPFTGDDTLLPSTAWHAEFQDVNNDGYVDLFIAKGNVEAMPDFAQQDPSNLLLGQPDGTFAESAEAAGVLSFARGRGAALADFNLDGMLDLVEVNRRENVKLWRSVGSGTADQPAPIGQLDLTSARAVGSQPGCGRLVDRGQNQRTDTIQREVTVGGGHAGGQLGWIHFGLGDAVEAEIRVQWPDGEFGPWLAVAANQFLTVERGASEAVPWLPLGG